YDISLFKILLVMLWDVSTVPVWENALKVMQWNANSRKRRFFMWFGFSCSGFLCEIMGRLFLVITVFLLFSFPVQFVFEDVQFFEFFLPGLKGFFLLVNVLYDLLHQWIVFGIIGKKLEIVLQLAYLGLALINFSSDE